MTTTNHVPSNPGSVVPGNGRRQSIGAAALLTALGVVYGDIGTSPLYAFKSSMDPLGKTFGADAPLGVASLIFWALTLIVALKYVFIVLRADHEGEGGILALTSLLNPWGKNGPRKCAFSRTVIILGLIGCSLLIGDGFITPAISVLSAVEGLKTVFPGLSTDIVLALTVGILVALFLVQSRGTYTIGRVFGPVMLVWFVTIGGLGIWNIIQYPAVVAALNPLYAIRFAVHEPAIASVFGAVFLALTGGEAMYADMGHCGKSSIRTAWFLIVMPTLVLNYLGQGALVLANPHILDATDASTFFSLAPEWMRLPLVALATLSTVIASQALISGVFSLVRQATTLGLCPRFAIRQTRSGEYGQIYVPVPNWALMVGCIFLVLGFRSSDAMASAYGIAVSMTMLITTLLIGLAMRTLWKWPLPLVAVFIVVFGAIDSLFVVSNMLKVVEGGWVPLCVGLAVYLLMRVWTHTSTIVRRHIDGLAIPLEQFEAHLEDGYVTRIPKRIQVCLTRTREGMPAVLCDFAAKTGSLAEHVVILTFETERGRPHLRRAGNISVAELGHGLWRVTARYGYMQTPRVGAALREAELRGLPFSCASAPIIMGRETVSRKASSSEVSALTSAIYGWMLRNSARADAFFKVKQDRVMEVGVHIEI